MSLTDKTDYEDELLEDIQEYEYQEMFEKANNIVLGFAASTGATGAIPIPFADAPLLIGQQVAPQNEANRGCAANSPHIPYILSLFISAIHGIIQP